MSDNSSSIISSLVSGYTPYEKEDKSTGDNGLGPDDFLTLLVAQLNNQNPLDPADTDQFTDQLAQFSQLEQLINVNDKLDAIFDGANGSNPGINAMDYVGMQVTGTINTMTVENGSVTAGYYSLDETADVYVLVYDKDGNLVNTIDEGQANSGSYLITWDGSDSEGEAVDDGTYTYVVMANSGDGYEAVSSTLTGSVDSVVFIGNTPYLVISGVLMDISSVTSATNAPSNAPDATSILEYLGKTVSSYYPIVQVDNGTVSGGDLTYYLENQEGVTITIYNANDEAVATIEVDSGDTVAGNNSAHWDALNQKGYGVSDGLYYYTVKTESGASVTTPVSGEVTSITTVNGIQYLTLGESGRLVSLSNVRTVQ